MNVIQQQADDFDKNIVSNNRDYNLFINSINKYLENYKKDIQKIIFLERIFSIYKVKYDRHLKFCSEENASICRFRKYHETILFFLQSEIDELENKVSNKYLKKNTRILINQKLDYFIYTFYEANVYDVNNYSIFRNEMYEMKNFYYLDKKSWRQLFMGKIVEMQLKKIISTQTSKTLLSQIDSAFSLRTNDYFSLV